MHANMSPQSLFFSLAILILWGFGISDGHAEFGLNFQKNPGGTVIYGMECNINGLGACASWTSADSVTPFLQETVSDGTASYWHMIVGNPATGFAQETYIRMWGSQDSVSGPTMETIR